MKLTNEDIAFIAEMRSEKICWKNLARVYGTNEKYLRKRWYLAMIRGMK